MPIARTYDELVGRARAGDARAACRLAQDLEKCASLPHWRTQAEFDETGLIADLQEKKGKNDELVEGMIDNGATKREIRDRLESFCADLPTERTHEAFDWMLKAADAGSIAASSRFAARPPIPFGDMLNQLDRMQIYRDRAPGLARRALAAGDTDIIVPLYWASVPTNDLTFRTLLGQAVQADPIEAYALLRLQVLIAGKVEPYQEKSFEHFRQTMTPDQIERGEKVAADLRRGPYAKAPPPPPRSRQPELDMLEKSYCEQS